MALYFLVSANVRAAEGFRNGRGLFGALTRIQAEVAEYAEKVEFTEPVPLHLFSAQGHSSDWFTLCFWIPVLNNTLRRSRLTLRFKHLRLSSEQIPDRLLHHRPAHFCN